MMMATVRSAFSGKVMFVAKNTRLFYLYCLVITLEIEGNDFKNF